MKLLPLVVPAALLVAGVAFFTHAGRPALAKETEIKPSGMIGYVNIAAVLNGYHQSQQRGADLNERRMKFQEKAVALRNEMTALNQKIATTADEAARGALTLKLTVTQRKIEDYDRECAAEMKKLGDDAVLKVYTEIREVIEEMATARDLDAVFIYPAGKELNAHLAQMMLQTPAAYPIYVKPQFNMTDAVIAKLNEKFPPSKTP